MLCHCLTTLSNSLFPALILLFSYHKLKRRVHPIHRFTEFFSSERTLRLLTRPVVEKKIHTSRRRCLLIASGVVLEDHEDRSKNTGSSSLSKFDVMIFGSKAFLLVLSGRAFVERSYGWSFICDGMLDFSP